MKASLERTHQDRNFKISYINGQKIEQLIGLVSKEDHDEELIMVNVKLEGLEWQRFFLDAFIGFWEVSCNYVDDSDEDIKSVDYLEKYELGGKSVMSAECVNGEIVLVISDGSRLALVLKNSTVCDTDSKLVLVK